MATSGVIQQKTSGKSYLQHTVQLNWRLVSQSIMTNTSRIEWWLTITAASSVVMGFSDNPASTITVAIDGQTYSKTMSMHVISAKATEEIARNYVTLTHNSNGVKSFNYSFTLSHGRVDELLRPIDPEIVTASGVAELPAIPGKPVMTSAPNFTDEDTPSITYSNPAGDTTTLLQAAIINPITGAEYAAYRNITKSGTMYRFDLTNAERTALRNAIGSTGKSASVRFIIKYSFGDDIDYSYMTRTVTLLEAAPILSVTKLEDTNATTVALTGNNKVIVSGYSNIAYQMSVAAQKGASVSSYSVTNGSTTRRNMASGTFSKSRSKDFLFTAQDSRGYVTEVAEELDIVNYYPVTCNQDIRLNLDGTIDATITGKYFNGSFGKVNNELTIKMRYRRNGEAWGDYATLPPYLYEMEGNTYVRTTTISGFDPSGTYEFQCQVEDKLTTATSGIGSVVLKPIFDWGRNDFNFNVPISIEGQPLADFVIATGSEAMGTNGTWYWRKWNSGRAEAWGRRNFGAIAVTTAWGNLYRSGVQEQMLPLGIFLHTPDTININLVDSDFGGWVCKHELMNATSETTGGFIVVRPASATLARSHLTFYVAGRWK